MRLMLTGDVHPIEAIGELIEIEPNYGELFVVHQSPHGVSDLNIDRWRVSHVDTGYRVSWGLTIDAAIQHAKERLAMVGEDGFLKALEKARAELKAK
jgi:hypothetical protein